MTRIERINFPVKVQRAALERARGKCERCGRPFDLKNKPECDHVQECWEAIARGEKPDATLANCVVLGRLCCHEAKSAAATTRRKKADRAKDKHVLNIKRQVAKIPSRPFQRTPIDPGPIGSKGQRQHEENMRKAGKPIVRAWFLK